jgi:hypothetical protein
MFNNTLCYEKCYFCKEETDMWHTPTNTPVCEKCAAIKDRKDIKKPQVVITIQ